MNLHWPACSLSFDVYLILTFSLWLWSTVLVCLLSVVVTRIKVMMILKKRSPSFPRASAGKQLRSLAGLSLAGGRIKLTD